MNIASFVCLVLGIFAVILGLVFKNDVSFTIGHIWLAVSVIISTRKG